ncbi:DUF4158 domain-containing protein [Saccharothrix sp. ST-888]|uniref:DUF4158 domain-containing protein n=1 Tax=Saccharothrix sp. ST-888 TaxID=1427391 RepID=UPI001E3EACA3|nr:DUF4158 domain-containing protein [Saccharothrix sp. ST-888]
MATRVFSDEELEALRSFPAIGKDDLIRYFTLTSADEAFWRKFLRPQTVLGAAVQLCTLIPATGAARLLARECTTPSSVPGGKVAASDAVAGSTASLDIPFGVFGPRRWRWHALPFLAELRDNFLDLTLPQA